jgi:hypothetical protein
MASPAPRLEVVRAPDEVSPEAQAMLDVIAGLERDVRGWAKRFAELQRDKNAEARAHDSWPKIMLLFRYWQEMTGHTRARWTGDRFWLALPLWQEFGTGNCAAGVAGIAHDPNRKPMKNGKVEVYDGWDLLFRSTATLERYIVRRPRGWVLPPQFGEAK